MNRRQKTILRDFVTVVVITAIAVVALINFRDWVNRSEAKRGMKRLGKIVLQYRKDYGGLPPESYIANIREDLKGHVRLGEVRYRALWLDSDSTKDEILAYSEINYRPLLVGRGYVVVRVDGRVEWMGKKEFETLLAQQQSPEEQQQSPEEIQMRQQ